MKITVAGWPGAGSTSLVVLMAYIFGLKIYSTGSLFRYIGNELDFGEYGKGRISADQYLEDKIGRVVDEFVDRLFLDETIDNIIIDSDLAGFRLGKYKEVFSIFLVADESVRFERLAVDKRKKDQNYLKERELENAKMYKDLHGINWLDLDEIKETHDLVLDNSGITIAEEIEEFMKRAGMKSPDKKTLQDAESLFWQKGKSYFDKYVNKASPESMLEEIESLMPGKFPKNIFKK